MRFKSILTLSVLASVYIGLLACQGGGGGIAVPGNENGSSPLNNEEAKAYKNAIMRCYKTGGSRVVKIEGKLNCY